MRRIGDHLRAIGEMHVAAEIGLLDVRRTPVWSRRPTSPRAPGDRRPATLPRAARVSRYSTLPPNVALCRPVFGAPVAVNVADRMRFAGASPSGGRSTWTFSLALRFVTVFPSGDSASSTVFPAIRLPGPVPSPGSWTTAFSNSVRMLERPSVVGVGQVDIARRHVLRPAAVPAADDPAVAAELQQPHALIVFGQQDRDVIGVDGRALRRGCAPSA